MSVAGDHLGARWFDLQVEAFTDEYLNGGRDVGIGADGAADLSAGHPGGSFGKALPGAGHFEGPAGELEAEADGFGPDSVGTAQHWRGAVFQGTAFRDIEQSSHPP